MDWGSEIPTHLSCIIVREPHSHYSTLAVGAGSLSPYQPLPLQAEISRIDTAEALQDILAILKNPSGPLSLLSRIKFQRRSKRHGRRTVEENLAMKRKMCATAADMLKGLNFASETLLFIVVCEDIGGAHISTPHFLPARFWLRYQNYVAEGISRPSLE